MSTQLLVNDVVSLLDAPGIPDLTFRNFRGDADFPHMLAVIDGSKDADGVERSSTLEEITNNYRHLDNCDPYQDLLIAEVNGQVIAYNRVFWERQLDGERMYTAFGFLLPDWRRKRIGTAMLHWGESRLRAIAANHPNDGPRFFQSWAADTEKGALALLEQEGYQPIRWGFQMARDLSEPFPDLPLPDGLEIRPVQKEHTRLIWDAMSEAFRDHWGYVPPTDEGYQGWLNDPNTNFDLYKVAWDGDQVAGMVQNFILNEENKEYNRKRGYTEGICVRSPWRKRGLARALIVESMKMFKEMGMTETALGVDTQNTSGALNVYKSVGYREYKTNITYRKPME